MVFIAPKGRTGQVLEQIGHSGSNLLEALVGHKLAMKQQAALESQKQQGRAEQMNSLLQLLGFGGEAGGGMQGVSEEFAEASTPQGTVEELGIQTPGGSAEVEGSQASPQQLLLASLLNPQAASVVQRAQAQNQKAKQFEQAEKTKLSEARASREHGIGSKTFERAEQIAERLPHVDRTINELNQSVDKAGFWSLGNLSRLTGIKGLENPDSAVFNSAVKELFLSDVKGIARPNQFIERTLSSALPEVGKNKTANKAVILGMEAKRDIDRAWSDKVDEVGSRYLEDKGYVPANVAKLASTQIDDFVKERYVQLSKDLKTLGVGKGVKKVEIKGPDGKRYSIPESQKKEFLRFLKKQNG